MKYHIAGNIGVELNLLVLYQTLDIRQIEITE